MLEAVRPSGHQLGVLLHLSFGGIVMVMVARVLRYAASTVVEWHESVEAAPDDAFAVLACDVGDVRDGSAILAPGRVRGEGHHATTTCNIDISSALALLSFFGFSKSLPRGGASRNKSCAVRYGAVTRPRPVPAQTSQAKPPRKQGLTTFEITLRVDTLPRAWTTAVNTARQPTVSPLRARAAANPSSSVVVVVVHPMRGTRALGHAFVVADLHVFPLASALFRFVCRERRESVRTHESTWASVDTGGRAVLRINALS